MEDEGKIALSIKIDGEAGETSWDINGFEEMLSVIVAITNYARVRPEFLAMLLYSLQKLGDEEFRQVLDEHVIAMPDFNDILKNTKNNG